MENDIPFAKNVFAIVASAVAFALALNAAVIDVCITDLLALLVLDISAFMFLVMLSSSILFSSHDRAVYFLYSVNCSYQPLPLACYHSFILTCLHLWDVLRHDLPLRSRPALHRNICCSFSTVCYNGDMIAFGAFVFRHILLILRGTNRTNKNNKIRLVFTSATVRLHSTHTTLSWQLELSQSAV